VSIVEALDVAELHAGGLPCAKTLLGPLRYHLTPQRDCSLSATWRGQRVENLLFLSREAFPPRVDQREKRARARCFDLPLRGGSDGSVRRSR
jgi:hypothetical protein